MMRLLGSSTVVIAVMLAGTLLVACRSTQIDRYYSNPSSRPASIVARSFPAEPAEAPSAASVECDSVSFVISRSSDGELHPVKSNATLNRMTFMIATAFTQIPQLTTF